MYQTRWELLPTEQKLSEAERRAIDYIESHKQKVLKAKNAKFEL